MIIDKIINSLLLLVVPSKSKPISSRRQTASCKVFSCILATALLLLSFLFLFSSCAYYNTFYNAEKYYKEGLSSVKRNPSVAKASFDKAIEKSALVITKYPRSKYTPKALFIIGMSYYYTKEYPKAISKFENLLLVFPKSKFTSEANLYWAACLIETQDFNGAIERLQNLKQTGTKKSIPKSLAEIALYKTGELYFVKKDYLEAERELKSFIARYPKSEYLKDALLMLGDAQRALKNHSAAITTFKTYLQKLKTIPTTPKADTSKDRVKGTLRLAQCLIESNQESEGLKILDEIVSADTIRSNLSKLDNKTYLELGRLFLNINNRERARFYLKKIRTTQDIVEAFYLIGNSYELEAKFDTAKLYYDSVVMKKIENEYTALAQSRLELLKLVVSIQKPSSIKKDTMPVKPDTLEEFLLSDNIQFDSLPADTLKHITVDTIKPVVKQDTVPETDSAAIHFHLAEIYNLNLKQYERAITEYEKVYQQYPKSLYAPKALFAQAWIYKNILGAEIDTSQYHFDYKRVLNNIITQFPNTEYATAAQEMLSKMPQKP